MKLFLLVFDPQFGKTDEVTDFLDKRPEILNWMTHIPRCVFIVSRKNTATLTDILAKKFTKGFFLITNITDAPKNGLLDEAAWEFINNPKPADG